MKLDRLLCLDDFAAEARKKLPRCLFEFVEGGAQDAVSLRDNRAAFECIRLRPRVLRDTSARNTQTTTLGQEWSAPFGIAPMGGVGLAAYRGDLALARAAAKARVPFILSGSSLVPLEQVQRENPDAWFQIYASERHEDNVRLLERASASGVRTLVVTVDVPVAGNRERDIRNGFGSPLRPSLRLACDGLTHPRWLVGTFGRTLVRDGMPHFENFAASRAPVISRTAARVHRRDNLSWDTLQRLRAQWKHRLVLKGLLSSLDVQAAAQSGIDGVVVSNHGGRQLDGTVAPVSVLPEAQRVKGSMELFFDSGVRRGADVLKAYGLGASHVFIGRPFLYAAAIAGEEGVLRAIELMRAEISRDMALLGCEQLSEVASRIVHTQGVDHGEAWRPDIFQPPRDRRQA